MVPHPGRPEFTREFDAWSEQLLGYWAGLERAEGVEEATYEVHRSDSAWEAVIHEPDRPPRPLTLPDWDDLYKEHPRSDSMISDDSSGALVLAHELIRRAHARSGITIEPFGYQPEVVTFANQHLRTIPKGQARTFSESFLRFWRAERLGRMGFAAAG